MKIQRGRRTGDPLIEEAIAVSERPPVEIQRIAAPYANFSEPGIPAPYADLDDVSVFDDRDLGPGLVRGRDGNYHDDPYCGNAAPWGSIEAAHGEPCGACERRRESGEQ